MKAILVALSLSAATLPVLAEARTVTLSVPGMNCAAGPITVKKALSRVPGVRKTEIRPDQREAIVTFNAASGRVQPSREPRGDAAACIQRISHG
jgi:mercuric ion binding protein